ncbi:MAG: hypothetical protein ABIP06_00615, partial [Pyrinomonadaceae bacterium]
RLGWNTDTGKIYTCHIRTFPAFNCLSFRHRTVRFSDADYNFFTHAQKYFSLTKQKLKKFDLESIYLKEIAEYVKFVYPKSVPKKTYAEYDWNWLTQDFHLYVYREILELDTVDRISVQQKAFIHDTPLQNFRKPEVMNIYVP